MILTCQIELEFIKLVLKLAVTKPFYFSILNLILSYPPPPKKKEKEKRMLDAY